MGLHADYAHPPPFIRRSCSKKSRRDELRRLNRRIKKVSIYISLSLGWVVFATYTRKKKNNNSARLFVNHSWFVFSSWRCRKLLRPDFHARHKLVILKASTKDKRSWNVKVNIGPPRMSVSFHGHVPRMQRAESLMAAGCPLSKGTSADWAWRANLRTGSPCVYFRGR